MMITLISLTQKENRITKESHGSLRLNKSLSEEAYVSQEHNKGSSKVILKLCEQALSPAFHALFYFKTVQKNIPFQPLLFSK